MLRDEMSGGRIYRGNKMISMKVSFYEIAMGIIYMAKKLLSLKLPAKKLLRRKG